jgi:RHS repeat-associated protein
LGVASVTFTGDYDPSDRLNPTFNFDANGNQLNDSRGFTYTYNSLNQLTRVQGTGVDVSYVYDGDGLRVQKTNSITGVVTTYLWDNSNISGYPQVVEELDNGSVTRKYVYGPQGALYVTQLISSSWVTSYLGKDATGTIRFLMDSTGHITDSFERDAFGNLLSRTGTTPMFLGHQCEYTEPETGLVYLRARWYYPDLGRFMGMDSYEGDQEDPLTLHKYLFGWDDPVDKMDPTGMAARIDQLMKGIINTGNNFKVTVRFSYLGSFFGFHPWYHAYILLTDQNGDITYYRGGPSKRGPLGSSGTDTGPQVSSGSGGASSQGSSGSGSSNSTSPGSANGGGGNGPWGHLTYSYGPYTPNTPDWETGNPPSMQVNANSSVFSLTSLNNSFVDELQLIDAADIPYNPFTTNSNAVVRTLLQSAGLNPSNPPVSAPGWNTRLPGF